MSYNNILTEINDGIETITINRPSQLNALNGETIAELSSEFTSAEADNQVRVIVLTGSGEKAFVAGADIKEFANYSVEEGKMLSKRGHDTLFDLVENLKTPVIAAINGFALGGGLELAMSSHIRIASDNAKLGLPEVSLGVIPGYGGTQRLPQLVGKGIANELIFSAQMIGADRAGEIGLVNHVVPQAELMETTYKLAGKIARNSPMAISLAIEAVNAVYDESENGFETEIECFGKAFGTEDFKEGTSAFIEKRRASFTGE
ncbi:MAG: enoyl-CoA hydratase [Crocinitomicaceae bacterium]|nr:enoyl-CoA hydratase [Crocinitomicaceae bacterium]|tara:strand:+ start:34749 stop:35531 length:783 start_codon:yes stop_codon:yes gene_type:complete